MSKSRPDSVDRRGGRKFDCRACRRNRASISTSLACIDDVRCPGTKYHNSARGVRRFWPWGFSPWALALGLQPLGFSPWALALGLQPLGFSPGASALGLQPLGFSPGASAACGGRGRGPVAGGRWPGAGGRARWGALAPTERLVYIYIYMYILFRCMCISL